MTKDEIHEHLSEISNTVTYWLLLKYDEPDQVRFCEDAAQEGVLQLLRKITGRVKGGTAVEYPEAYAYRAAERWLWKCLKGEKKARLIAERAHLERSQQSFSQTNVDLDNVVKRTRQSNAYGEMLRAFIAYCEDPSDSTDLRIRLRMKECFERRVMGQGKNLILAEMQQYTEGTSKLKNTLDQMVSRDLRRAKTMLKELRKVQDPHQSLLTADPKTREKRQSRRPRARASERSGQASSDRDPKAQVVPLTANSHAADYPPISTESELNTKAILDLLQRLPKRKTSKVIFRWLIRDTRAYCPSKARLDEFVAWRSSIGTPERFECPKNLLDVWYHAIERGCKYCMPALTSHQVPCASDRSLDGRK